MIIRRSLRITAVLFISLVFQSHNPALAQGGVTVLNPQVDYTFGKQISVQADLVTDLTVEKVQFVFRPAGTNNSIVAAAQRDQNNHLEASYNLRPQDRISPFAHVAYWFVVTASTGQQFQSEVFTFRYEDNRFQWQQLAEPGIIQVHWYLGDAVFGQAALDTALNATSHLNQYILLPEPSLLDIYIYANSNDLQTALSLTGQDWLAGHVDPVLNVALVLIADGDFDQLLNMERRIPHEIAHIRLYQQVGEAYAVLPAWFNEGIATLAQLSPDPDFHLRLQAAAEEDSLFPFSELCPGFPSSEIQIATAFAQSNSFLHYLHDTYGANGLQRLLDAYAQGETCEGAVQSALNRSLTALEKDWQRQTFEEPPLASSDQPSLMAWLFLLLLVMIAPISLILASGRLFEGDSDD